MWPDEGGTVAPPTSAWRLPSEHLALLVGAVTGGALVAALVAALVIWRCCLLPQRNKQYCTRIAEEMAGRHRSSMQSHCAVFADAKKGHWAYNSRLVGNTFTPDPGTHWFYNSRVLSSANLERIDPGPLSRSISYVHDQQRHPVLNNSNRKRPLSQPIRFGPCDFPNGIDCRRKHLPEISEFSTQPTQYASSSISYLEFRSVSDVTVSFILTVLDDSGCQGGEWIPGSALKTRSLPAWVRSRPKPLSTDDNLAELYAKVNFSKKRKNRMRNDEAAIIALSKSRSQYLHKDTDSLVDNEAVIVYDERTAL